MAGGMLCVLIGGVFWGVSGTCGQFLFMYYGLDTGWLTAVRMLGAGLVLFCVGMVKEREGMLGLWRDRKDALTQVIFSVCGLLFCQYSYMQAISYSNSGTATILQYQAPMVIMVITCAAARRLPDKREVLCIILALLGTFLLATHGDITSMVLTPLGLLWGLLAAAGLTLYTMLPVKLIGKWGSIPVVAYGMLIGGAVLALLGREWTYAPQLDAAGWAALAEIVLLGTVAAFTLYLQGVREIGAVRGSMLASIEPVAATVCMVVWLGSAFGPIDAAGFACILATVFLLAKE